MCQLVKEGFEFEEKSLRLLIGRLMLNFSSSVYVSDIEDYKVHEVVSQ